MSWIPTVPQAWALLALAIAFEVVGTTCMKLADGFSNWLPAGVMFACYALAFACNTFVVRTLDLSVTYAVWSGVGTLLTAAVGILWFREPATVLKLVSIGLIVIGVLGLHSAAKAATVAATG
jgi:small multidrug resistance pump